jgi:hypothetical protein
MIDAGMGPDMGRLPALPMPRFEAAPQAAKDWNHEPSWVKRTGADQLRFQTVGQLKETELVPLYQVLDERYSVYWQKAN